MESTPNKIETTITTLLRHSRSDFNRPDLDSYYAIVLDVLAKVSKILPNASSESVLCSFQWRIHPKYGELKKMSDAWVQAHVSDNTIIGYEKLLKSDYPLISCMVYARGKSELMPSLLKQMVWFFVLDNYLDDPSHMGADIIASEKLVSMLMDVFCLQDTMTTHNNYKQEEIVKQVEYRQRNHIPDLDTYKSLIHTTK